MNRVILKVNTSGKIEVFTSLRKMYAKFPEIEAKHENIVKYLTRLKKDYVSDIYTLRRVAVNET